MRATAQRPRTEDTPVPLPIWQEVLALVEVACLQVSPVWWGYGVPHGDGSAVIVIPGFLGTDEYLDQLRNWLDRIGYKAYCSGIGLNAECPNLLIRWRLTDTIKKAYLETGRKVHVIGHSLGGMIARAMATQMPDRIASVVTLGSPMSALACHPVVLKTAEMVRTQILQRHGKAVLPECYTARCACAFLEGIRGEFPESVRQTAIYTKCDGIVDWRVCRTGNPDVDVEVSATHLGLAFSPLVYSIIGSRLAGG